MVNKTILIERLKEFQNKSRESRHYQNVTGDKYPPLVE